MPISISSKAAEASLRAAAKAGYKDLASQLLQVGVKASSQNGIAIEIAEFYHHPELANLLRSAFQAEQGHPYQSPSP